MGPGVSFICVAVLWFRLKHTVQNPDGLSVNLPETFIKPPRRFPNYFIDRIFIFLNFVLIKTACEFPGNPSLTEALF
jgi:hypothetical protein